MKGLIRRGTGILLLVFYINAHAQVLPAPDQFIDLPARYFSKVNDKIGKLNGQLSRQTEKYLQRLARQEAKLKRKISRFDTTSAKKIFAAAPEEYNSLITKMKDPGTLKSRMDGEYLPYLDSLNGSLSFLEKNKDLIAKGKNVSDKLSKSINNMEQLQSRMQQAEQVKQFIRERKQRIKEALSKYTKLPGGITKSLQQFNKEAVYYSQQIREYKEMLNDPDKLTRRALSLLNKIPTFKDFMKWHSQLAGLFGVPAGYGNITNLGGLQTRTQVQALMQNQLASAGNKGQQVMQQNLQAAQAQLNKYKDKLKQLGRGGGDMDMPDFKPNNQRTKNFFQRLEIGTSLQSSKSSFFFPTTTDIGLSVGYKLSDKSLIGIGGCYRVGWGKDIKNIVVTSQGAGVRSFLDIKLKGSFYASGGFEYNYQPVDTSGVLLNASWTKSGLVGISKIVSFKSKFFKKTKMQLLWDFLSYGQLPRREALKFRLGYNF